MTQTHFSDADRTVERKRRDGARSGAHGAGGRRLSADPRVHDDAEPLRSSAADAASVLGFNNTNSLVRGGQWDIQAEQDRVHPRSRQVPGDARQYRQPAGRHRAAGFVRQADAHRRRQRVKHWLETGEALPLPAAVACVDQGQARDPRGARQLRRRGAATRPSRAACTQARISQQRPRSGRFHWRSSARCAALARARRRVAGRAAAPAIPRRARASWR